MFFMKEQRTKECKNCKKPCTIFYTQISGKETVKIAMCKDCPSAHKIEANKEIGSIAQLIKMVGPILRAKEAEICKFCGKSWQEIERTKLLGCPGCYEFFSKKLPPLIENLHPNFDKESHIDKEGKVPLFGQEQNRMQLLLWTQNELKKAIEAEDYEKAANYRDKIKRYRQFLEKFRAAE